MSKILVIGRATIDFNPIDIHKPLSESTTFKKYVGGSACNTAIGLRRLGQEVGMVTKVSDDQFGEYVSNYLATEGINVENVVVDPQAKIGLTFTEILSETESSILMYRDNVADLNLEIGEIDEGQVKKYDVIVISGTALASNSSRAAIFYLIELCKRFNKKIVFDLDYRPYTWKNERELGLVYYMVAKSANAIIGSKMEFELMNEVADVNNVFNYPKVFLNENAEHIVIKDGSNGSKYYSKEMCFKVNVFPVKLLKSFGGGDAYVSALLSSILDGLEITEALYKATAHAAMLVNSHSCSDALANNARITEFIIQSGVSKNDIIEEIDGNFKECE